MVGTTLGSATGHLKGRRPAGCTGPVAARSRPGHAPVTTAPVIGAEPGRDRLKPARIDRSRSTESSTQRGVADYERIFCRAWIQLAPAEKKAAITPSTAAPVGTS